MIELEETTGSTVRRFGERPGRQQTRLSSASVLAAARDIFLPAGYPRSVSADYVAYQTWDSIQAFVSGISFLIANRAVLAALGVGDAAASSTGALLLKIVQEAVGRMATVAFAWRWGSVLEQDCKTYRFAADVVLTGAIACDCISPSVAGGSTLAVVFCLSAVLKAVCTVMAQGSRAALSLHFTDPEHGSISDVAAKDASQETVVSLAGLLAGSAVVPHLTTARTTWTTLAALSVVHLAANYRAVRAVTLRTLNRQRAALVFSHATDPAGPAPPLLVAPADAAAREVVLERDGRLRWRGRPIGHAALGSFAAVEALRAPDVGLAELVDICGSAGFLLWYAGRPGAVDVRIALTEPTVAHAELRAWAAALFVARLEAIGDAGGDAASDAEKGRGGARKTRTVRAALAAVDALFADGVVARLAAAGWVVDRPMIAPTAAPRVRVIGR
ncbi:vitamin B6 photo-protection and homoeostasis-domain-containing protein [Dipodascopsis tothii]|uniref:vitamin B6 photo-protection and homoeostasis-domain-containing protein n=1 Tax=Dipodascopsis tothii TaxID=44089 RepID=UPI0034CDBE00